MKTKSFFTMALAVILLSAACSKEDTGRDPDNGIVTNPTGDAWLSLKVNTPEAGFTKGLNTTPQQSGTEAESKINTIRVILFTGVTSTPGDEVVTFDQTFTVGTDPETGSPNQPSGGAGTAFKVPATSKRILIIANPAAGVPSTTVNSTTYATLNAAIPAAVATVATDNSFMMTNAKGDLEPSTPTGGTADLTLYNSAANAQSNPTVINIDRVAAKVRVYFGTGTTTSVNNVITDAGWVLNVTNKSYFPVSKRTMTWNENTANAGALGLGRAPFDQYKLGSYRIDPNYDTQPATTPAATYDAVYNYHYNAAPPATWLASGVAEYCLENTQVKESADATPVLYNSWAYTTQVLFKAVYAPTGLKNPDGTAYDDASDNVSAGTLASGTAFLQFNGGYYTWKLLMKYLENELLYKYTHDTDAGVTPPVVNSTPLCNTLNAYITACGGTAVTIPARNDATGTAAAQAAAVITLFNAQQTAVTTKGAFRSGTVSYYAGGVTYYPIMIRHDDTEAAVNELGEFGVTRNSVYDVQITKISNAGYPTIPDPDETIPDESDDTYISVQINVNPWTWYTQNVEL